jgi:pyrroloquinoline quinone biosynthesis protein B
MVASGLGTKTGQSMGHISMSGHEGAIAALADLGIARRIFLHINNSNPVLLPTSEERIIAEGAGWQIAADGTEIVL